MNILGANVQIQDDAAGTAYLQLRSISNAEANTNHLDFTIFMTNKKNQSPSVLRCPE